MEELGKIRYFYQLKSVYRACSVGQRKESSAEHTWSCLVLADYFLSKMKHKLDEKKIFDMLLYHEMDYKQDWKGWTEEFLRKKKQHLYDDFPEMKELFEEATIFARENGFLEQ